MKIIFIITILFISSQAQNEWFKLNGPQGANSFGLIVKNDTMLVGTGHKGLIFFSTNQGMNWTKSNIKVNNAIADFVFTNDGAIISAAVFMGLYKSFDMINWSNLNVSGTFISLGKDANGYIYAGTDEGKLFGSADNGTTWQLLLNNLGSTKNFVFTEDSMVYAAVYRQIKKKNISSLIWETIALNDSFNTPRVLLDSVDNLYTYSYSYIQRSTDKGLSWSILDSGGFLHGNSMYDCIFNNRLIGAFNDETAYFGTGWGVAVSDDLGKNWHWSNTGLPPSITAFRLAVNGNETLLSTHRAGVFKSTDYGDSWFPINNGITAATVLSVIVGKDSIIYAASAGNSLSKSTDKGETWINISNGITNCYLYSVVQDDNGILIAGTSRGTFRSTDLGYSWVKTTSAGNDAALILRKDKQNRIYSFTYGSGFYRTTDQGNSWVRMDNGFISPYTFGFSIDKNGNIYAGSRRGAIYKSTNDGNTWMRVYLSSHTNSVISHISISPDGHIFATNLYEGVLRSTDNGITWINVKPEPGFHPNRWPIAINSLGHIYTSGLNNKIYLSKDNGNSWEDATLNLELMDFYDIFIDSLDRVYLGTDESLWWSGDIVPVELLSFYAGVDKNNISLIWSTATETNNKGFEIERAYNNKEWLNISFVEGKGTTTEKQNYTFTDENLSPGNYKYRLKQIDYDGTFEYSDEIEVTINIPYEYSLSQNYPNPFNPSTKIKYTIAQHGNVLLKVFDVLGNEVAVLVNKEQEAGEYEIDFNAGSLASGIYFYKLKAGEFSETRKMIVIR